LDELERLAKLQQQKLDLETFEGVELKRLIKKEIREDRDEKEGVSPWK